MSHNFFMYDALAILHTKFESPILTIEVRMGDLRHTGEIRSSISQTISKASSGTCAMKLCVDNRESMVNTKYR